MHAVKRLLVLLLMSAKLFAVCTAAVKKSDYANISTSPNTLAATVFALGDGMVFEAWCFPSGTTCPSPTLTLGSQSATLAPNSGAPANSDTGEGWMFYILSTTVTGAQTVTLTGSGSTQFQVAYQDFAPSAGCSFVFDTATLRGHGTSGTANLPVVSPGGSGEVVVIFTWVSVHVTNVNAPLACLPFTGSGQTGDCSFDGTRNAVGWVLSSSGTVTNNMTMIHVTDDWEAQGLALSMSSGGGAVTNPQHSVIF